MGVFALIGLVIVAYGMAEHDRGAVLLGLIIFGVGAAADQNGY